VIGGPRRQHLQSQPTVPFQELANDGAFVIAAVVPPHQEVAAQVSQQVAKELGDLVGREEPVGFRGEVKAEPPAVGRDAQAADDGNLVAPAAGRVEDRRLADCRPSPPYERIEKQAGFVDQDEMGVGVARFFECAASRWPPGGGWPVRGVVEPSERSLGRVTCGGSIRPPGEPSRGRWQGPRITASPKYRHR